VPANNHPVRVAALLRGETLTEVAEAVGVRPRSLYNVLGGRERGSAALRSRIAEHLGVPEAELFTQAERELDSTPIRTMRRGAS
jgi:transcriptional regulator with XRE-family HTH domain